MRDDEVKAQVDMSCVYKNSDGIQESILINGELEHNLDSMSFLFQLFMMFCKFANKIGYPFYVIRQMVDSIHESVQELERDSQDYEDREEGDKDSGEIIQDDLVAFREQLMDNPLFLKEVFKGFLHDITSEVEKDEI